MDNRGLQTLLPRHKNLRQGLQSDRYLPPSVRTHHQIIFISIHCSESTKFNTQLTDNIIIIPPPTFYSDFMYAIKNTSTIGGASSNWKSHSRIIKNLLANFEAHQNNIINKEKKQLVESIKHIHINRWAKYRLSVKHENQSYKDWELMNACAVSVLLNAS